MKTIINDFVFYHIYPIGFCGAPHKNDFCSPADFRLDRLFEWTGHIKQMGFNAVYLGPIFESTSHGYDTVDYYHVDRRLGNNESFKKIASHLKNNGIKLVLDAVFNHVGRDFWAFKDVQYNLVNSRYKDWFAGLRFNEKSKYNDPFNYTGWNGHYSLVKLNLQNPEVKEHLFNAVRFWVNEFGIDGLRLDAADCLDFGFIEELSAFCRSIKPDLWLMGEVIHGDYNRWANSGMLDSVTNYECYKGLYSSHNDVNYFEIAYSLNRQFGTGGIYKNLLLYSFADNHDVNRVASSIAVKADLFPLYIIMFCMPGIPSVYYGSEWGIEGEKTPQSDIPLRPEICLSEITKNPPMPELAEVIKKLTQIRHGSKALKKGNYTPVLVKHRQFGFIRQYEDEKVIVIVNSSPNTEAVYINLPEGVSGRFRDVLNNEDVIISNGILNCGKIYPDWGCILKSAD
jgi:glycosidase